MMQNYLCISIPDELQQFAKLMEPDDEIIQPKLNSQDFGVKLIKDEYGNLTCAAYYSDTGELLKKILYKGSTISSIEQYRNNILYSTEKYDNGKITRKIKYDKSGKTISTISYEYNKKDQLITIRKFTNDVRYAIIYGYDELMRVNSRSIKIDDKFIEEQRYRYDILDRVVEYKDKNQKIEVHKLNPNNLLLSYTITDNIGNQIHVKNKFMCSEYIGTEIELNGHTTSIKEKSYLDNVMLKKPFTSEDDLDFVLSNIYKKHQSEQFVPIQITRRESKNNVINMIIDDKLKPKPEITILPISIRKRVLLNLA